MPWLGEPGWARASVIIVNVWAGTPFFMIMYLAALKSVPDQLYEAAAIDGATGWQGLRFVTLPMMRNIISITVLFSLIVTFANYDIVRVLTNGGPRDLTHVFASYAFQVGVLSGNIPRGAAVSPVHVPAPRHRRLLHAARRQPAQPGDGMMSASAASPSAAHPGVARKIGSLRKERRWALITAYVSLIVAAIVMLAPPVYMLVTSLKTSAEISNPVGSPWLVRNPTLDNYWALISDPMFRGFFFNSIKITVAVVCITMVISVLAAFSLARMKFFGSGFLATGVFLTYLVPDTLLFIPLYQIVGGLGLLNSIWGLVLVYPTLTVPFCTWIMIGYFASIPKELDEAALIDGANWMQMLTKIFIPVALPGIIAATIFAFTVSWAAFVYPDRLHHPAGRDAADHRRRLPAHPRRHLRLGPADGGRAAGGAAAGDRLCLPHGLLHRRA